MSVLNTAQAQLWLTLFTEDERPIAEKMLSKFLFVPATEFLNGISHLARNTFSRDESVAFFVERELSNHLILPFPSSPEKVLMPQAIYKEEKLSRGRGFPKRHRATGAAFQAVRSLRNDRQEIGSEGLLATALTNICRAEPARFVLNPSANEFRDRYVRHVVIVTDFVGSGDRVTKMLQAFWRVRSIRSWKNGGLIDFSILCYSGTEAGIRRIRQNKLRPKVEWVIECPTITNQFRGELLAKVEQLCIARSPDPEIPLGYGAAGALLAFQHSCPNNVPAMFFKEKTSGNHRWQPLFPRRSTIQISNEWRPATVRQRQELALETLGYPQITVATAFIRASEERRWTIIVLAAVRRRHRNLNSLSTVTGLQVDELSIAVRGAQTALLLDHNFRLTEQGFGLLQHLSATRAAPVLSREAKSAYYPTSLRAPR